MQYTFYGIYTIATYRLVTCIFQIFWTKWTKCFLCFNASLHQLSHSHHNSHHYYSPTKNLWVLTLHLTWCLIFECFCLVLWQLVRNLASCLFWHDTFSTVIIYCEKIWYLFYHIKLKSCRKCQDHRKTTTTAVSIQYKKVQMKIMQWIYLFSGFQNKKKNPVWFLSGTGCLSSSYPESLGNKSFPSSSS